MSGQLSPNEPDLQGLTLLVVDDDRDTVQLLAIFLRASGAAVVSAHTAAGGLAYVDAAPKLDAVITDVSMPGVGGVDFVRSIRRHASPCRSSLPVIALTAFDEDDAPTQDFNAYLRKPADPDELCRVILRVIDHRRSAEGTDAERL
jgi:CheY-like chemotaxis protein